jgi:hypothetical protein
MQHASPRKSYYVVVSRSGDEQDCWYWEIRRKRRPMGIRLSEGGFASEHAAQLAGKHALEDLLNRLVMEASLKPF